MNWRLMYVLMLVVGFANETLAQDNSWTIRGKVLEVNKTPLQFVNVYVNNTSIGNATKADGTFSFLVPKSIEKVELVVSFIGYSTIKKVLSPAEMGKTIVFLLETSNLLKEIKVTAKRDKDWKKKWRIFRDGLLGESQFTSDCEIMNPEAISLRYDKNKNVVATASEPIFVINNGLGYKIMFQMEVFISDGKLTFFAGDKFFEILKPKDERQEKRWKKFRKRAYHDSFRNFLVSLSQQKLQKNGFEIFKEDKIKELYLSRTSVNREIKEGALFPCADSTICRYDSLSKRYTLYSDKPIMVFLMNHFNTSPIFADYPYKFSQIVLPNGKAEFTQNGWITKPNGIIIRDYWGNEGFSNLLPDDYEEENFTPENSSTEALAHLYSENEQKYWFIKGIVQDAAGLPVESADVFVSHTENGVKTNTEGKFTLKIPNTLSQLDLLVSHPKFYTAKRNLKTSESIEVVQLQLKPDNFSAKTEKDKEFQKNWKIFSKVLLGDPGIVQGKTLFPESCEITNPEVINFEYDEAKSLIAKAEKPLFIQNNALGYIITYQLNHFEYKDNESKINGDKFFEKLAPADEKQQLLWQKNQLKIYQESLKYFLLSAAQNKLKENGFIVFKMATILDLYDANVTVESQIADGSLITVQATDLCKFDVEANRFYLHSEYPLLVFLTNRNEVLPLTFKDYPYKHSQVVLPEFYLEFTKDGTITNYKNAEFRDFWANEGLSGSLPNDFVLNKENADRLSFETAQVITPKSINVDTMSRFSNGIQFNRTRIEPIVEKTYMSVPSDFSVRINDQDINLTVYDLLRRIPGLIVKYRPETGDYFIGFSSSLSFQGGAQPVALSIDNNFTDNQEVINAMLNALQVRDIATLGAIKYGNASAYGSRGGNGVVVITTKK